MENAGTFSNPDLIKQFTEQKIINIKSMQMYKKTSCTRDYYPIKCLKRTLKIMKTIFVLLLVGMYSVSAASYSQNAKVSISLKNSSVNKLFEEIKKQTSYSFWYDVSDVDENQKVSVNVENKSVKEVLETVFKDKSLDVSVTGNHIVISKAASKGVAKIEQSDKRTIRGKVLDRSGESIIGASVKEDGTSNGTITDIDGNFKLTLTGGKKLLVSYVGYENATVSIDANKDDYQVTLREDTKLLEEVVVVGYGSQKKANLTGSVATVNYDKEMANRPITNASQALSGKVSGVYASQNGGSPGSEGATIRIRGVGTLNNSDPLVLIDGVEGRLAEINPNDIASITVLKDAASAAIYGSRAANGVVLVETKTGDGTEKVSINYNGYFGFKQLGRKYDIISNSAEYMEIWNSALANEDRSALFPQDVIDSFRNGTDKYRYPNTNYFDEVYHTAFSTQHNVSASVGTKNSSTYISLSYLNDDGIVKNTSSERFSMNINSELKLSDRLKIGARGRMMRKVTDRPYDHISRVVYMMANGHPFSTPYLQDGETFGGTMALYESGDNKGQPIVDTRNPFPDLYNGQTQYVNSFFKGNVYLTANILDGLSVTAQYSGQYNNNNQDKYNEMLYTYTDLEGSNKKASLDFPTTMKVYRQTTDEYYGTFFANANYNKTFKDIHEISAVVGVQQEALTYRISKVERQTLPKEGLHQVDAGADMSMANGNKYLWRMLSYFGRVNYALMSRYLFEVNFRGDASSRFKKTDRWGYFPSFSAAWRVSEEPFMKNQNVVNNFKIRASWGKLGNQNIGTSGNGDYFPYLQTVSQQYRADGDRNTYYSFANTLAPGVAITQLVDPNITWETTTTTDIGVDLGFLNNRLTLEADYFDRKTSDIIVQLPIPLIMGNIGSPYENIGKVSNKGFEMNLGWQDNLPEADLTYNIGFNLTYLNNKVTKFREDAPDPTDAYLIREGYSYKTLYGFISEGVYQSDSEAKEHMKNNGYEPVAGDLRYKDVNGDGKLDYRDKQEIGNTIPKITYGINGSVAWKDFDLSFLFTGAAKYHMYTQNSWSVPLGISGGAITKRWRNASTRENPNSELPMIKLNDTWNKQVSSFWTNKMSWFKLKNIQLGYNVPKSLTDKLRVEGLYVYVNGTDLFTVVMGDDYEGFDPEQDTQSTGYSHYPLPRVVSFGLNINF